MSQPASDIHANQPVLTWGAPLESARAALILVHGRGASAADILSLAGEVAGPDVAAFAPQAFGNTWYPHRFLAPIEANEPYLTAALAAVGRLVERVGAAGLPMAQIVIAGFSQGACLALEYAARNPARYGGVIGLSGGLIGPEGSPFDYPGSMEGAPVFLGVADNDFHIPVARVQESAAAFERLGAKVTARLYTGVGHTVVDDEIVYLRDLIAGIGRA
ncbi:MAG: dienelactone hydrolase family protein [Anaerolineae bacterium]|nr:dienelactone hydrolase family protein [Anaerolineae bacterium]